MGKEKIEIPEGVVDETAYKKYLKLKDNPLLSTKRHFETSDGIKINLGSFPHIIQKKIVHLPIEEQNKIMTKKQMFFKVNNKASALKRQAFGFKQGKRKGDKGESLSMTMTRKADFLEYFGKMFSIDEVTKLANEEWGLPVSRATVSKFRKDHSKEIADRIEKFKSSYSDIRLGVKRSRLEELVYLYNHRKDKYTETTSREDYKLLLTTLEHIRKEAEGDRLTIDGKIDVKYEANINTHLRDEVFKTINIKEIILGRVAARMGISAVKLIHSLNNSFYKQFSNVLGDYDEEEAEGSIVYPSQMNYNFEEIKRKQQDHDDDIEEAEIVEEEDKEEQTKKSVSLKDILADKLKQKRENLKHTRSNSDADVDAMRKGK